MLGFFGIGKQTLDIGAKDSLAIRRRFFWRMTAEVMVVALTFFPVVGIGAVVTPPCAIKTFPLQQRDMMPEFSNCALNSGERLFEPSVNFRAGCWELGEHSSKLALNSGTENPTGENSTIVPLTQPRDKLRDQNTNKSYQCDGYCGLYLSLPLWIVAFWPGLITALWRMIVKPNAKLTGGALLRRPG